RRGGRRIGRMARRGRGAPGWAPIGGGRGGARLVLGGRGGGRGGRRPTAAPLPGPPPPTPRWGCPPPGRRRGGGWGDPARAPAEGIVRVDNQEMVRAMRVMTVERGVDPRGFALLPFGGAGPMHAAALAGELELSRIVCPRASGVLSALGLIAAGRRRDTARTVL